jgi:hypothetical protein
VSAGATSSSDRVASNFIVIIMINNVGSTRDRGARSAANKLRPRVRWLASEAARCYSFRSSDTYIQAHASGITHTNSPYNRYSRIRYPVLEGSGSAICSGSRVLLKIPNTSEQTVFEHVSERIDAIMYYFAKRLGSKFRQFLVIELLNEYFRKYINGLYLFNNLI